jgi:hypothetical protein
MRKLLIGVLLLAATGCYSFGRGVASRVVETLDMERGGTRQCEIRGGMFRGISAYLDQGETVKVLIVHGIGTHRPGHSAVISEGIAHSLGLTVFSNPADADILNPRDPAQRLTNLRIIRMRNPEGSRRLIFYELTWSDITAERKRVLDFDTSGEYAHRQASFNNIMKGFLNDVGPDAMIYVADRISAFGIEVVNPIAAHGNYDSDERVIELITQGNTELEKNELLSRRCRMIRIEN